MRDANTTMIINNTVKNSPQFIKKCYKIEYNSQQIKGWFIKLRGKIITLR